MERSQRGASVRSSDTADKTGPMMNFDLTLRVHLVQASLESFIRCHPKRDFKSIYWFKDIIWRNNLKATKKPTREEIQADNNTSFKQTQGQPNLFGGRKQANDKMTTQTSITVYRRLPGSTLFDFPYPSCLSCARRDYKQHFRCAHSPFDLRINWFR